jgi:NAD(P) transhydrogenase
MTGVYGFSIHNQILENQNTKSSSTFMIMQNTQEKYDLAVIGGGVVGVQAALAAASLSKQVCLIDAPRESGVLMHEDEDLSIGAPTGLFGKALRDTSKRIKVSTLRGMGLREDSIWNEIINSCVDLASSNAQDIMRQLEDANIEYIEGLSSFSDDGCSGCLFVSKSNLAVESIKAKNILIATGSSPFRQGGVPFDAKRIFDSDSINQLGYLPKSIAITGSGIIAVEYAKIFRNLGAEVTMIIRDQIPRKALMKIGLDKDIAATLVADMVRSGIKIERDAQVGHFEVPTSKTINQVPITIDLERKGGGPRPKGLSTELKCHAYLAAVGRKPNTSKLNLGAVGVDLDEYGGIVVDSTLHTSCKNVYAAGDVVGRPFLASTGTAQGIAAVNAMFAKDIFTTYSQKKASCPEEEDEKENNGNTGSTETTDWDPASLASNPFAVPCGIWSTPEAAYFGLSVQQAQELGIDAGEGIALYAECLRGRVFSPNGLLKLVFEQPAGRILGVHICGDDACELIHFGMELVNSQRTIKNLAKNLFAAVTFHEMYRLAAEDGLNPALGRKRRAAAGKALAKRNRLVKAKESQ